MAITISQQPTSPNMVNNDLLWTITSTAISQPQFQFICDIYQSGSVTRLQRVKQQPNPSGYGVFNLGQILGTYLEPDDVWKTTEFATSPESNKDFIIKFGEEYGTSTSSSVVTYTGIGIGTTGDPNKTGSAFYTITDGLVNYNEAVNWNFASSSYYTPESASAAETFNHQFNLSSAPVTQSIQDGEYATIALYNGNVDNDTVYAQDVAYVVINVYNAAGSNIQNFQIENTTANGGGPRDDIADLWPTVAADQTGETRLIHIGVGPQNIADNGVPLNANWAYYIVKPIAQSDDSLENNNGVWASIRFEKDTANCGYPGVRFAWKNEFGTWDYYTAKLAESTNSGVERKDYKQTFVNFSNTTSTVPYNTERRGKSQFYNAITKIRTVETDWLDQTTADWLRELFFSTNVYVQDGTSMLPVIITNVNITEKINPRTQKLFRYTAEYQYANDQRPRL